MLGIHGQGGGVIQSVVTDILQMSRANTYAVLISIAVLVAILGAKRISRKIPVALTTVVVLISVSYILNFASHGVSVLGAIPSGLPKLGFPNVPMSWNILQTTLSYRPRDVHNILDPKCGHIPRAYATRYNEPFNENIGSNRASHRQHRCRIIRDFRREWQPN